MLNTKIIKYTSRLPFHSPWFIIIIFSVLGLIGILNHSMWRDELNPWLIVRDSQSLGDLIANIHYEGHPVLWYFSLAILRKIVDNPMIMQIFHWAITFVNKWHHIALMLILYVQFGGGIYSFSRDLVVPFSASRETAQYIQKAGLNNEFIVASRDANMAPLAGYLNRKFYYPELQKIGSFTLFKKGRQEVEQAQILSQINSLLKNQDKRKKILLILNKKLNINRNDLKIVPIKDFQKSWVDSEQYYLYWVDKA